MKCSHKPHMAVGQKFPTSDITQCLEKIKIMTSLHYRCIKIDSTAG